MFGLSSYLECSSSMIASSISTLSVAPGINAASNRYVTPRVPCISPDRCIALRLITERAMVEAARPPLNELPP